jgi:multidrug efflux pump subunit AcrA (membrane-fusion protein)
MTQLLINAVALMLFVTICGCSRKSTGPGGAQASVMLGPQFSPNKGLFLPEDTRRSLGLKLVEVTEQKVPAILEVQLRVYQSRDTAALATGTVTPEQGKLLKPGQALHLQMDDKRSLPATVMGLDSELQKATGLIELLVEIPGGAGALKVGTFVPARVTLEAGEKVVTVPRAALLECSDGPAVYTVSGEHFVRTPVKVGAASGEFVEIRDGLYTGDQVVVHPVATLWLTELAAVKGGQACCAMPAKGK